MKDLKRHQFIYTKLIESDNNMYLASSNNITLRKNSARPFGVDKIYMDEDLIEGKPYEIIDQFSGSKTTLSKFYLLLLNKIHPSYVGNGRTCRILFANDDKIDKLIYGTKN